MLSSRSIVVVFTCAAAAMSAVTHADVEVESFSDGTFTNPFFNHALEFKRCCWEIADCNVAAPAGDGQCRLHLAPNTDLITFNLPAGFRVQSISVEIEDLEGGFTGVDPTTAIIVRASSNDFVALHAAELGVVEVVAADVDTIGQLFGEPLGDIVSLHFQAANEGNALVPGVGAFFDIITVEIVPICTGDLDGDNTIGAADLAALLGVWGACDEDCPADLDGDQFVGAADLAILLGNWGPCR